VTKDHDDTIAAGERPTAMSAEPDLDDTIVVPSRKLPVAVRPYPGSAATGVPAATSDQCSALYYRVQLDGAAGAHNLEHPCVFGRDPHPPRIIRGMRPRLIAVRSPNREVSETHVEICQRGSSVIVTDLRSTNGSVVQAPGNAARKLRQGESVVVSAGTLVDIGEGNIIRVLPRQRLE
jgi:hypothetical protein